MLRAHGRTRLFLWTATAVAAVAAVPASAGNVVKYDSQVTIGQGPPPFHGQVKSENPGCEDQRKVRMFKKKRGADKLLGRDKTNHRGHWKIVVDPLRTGAYYAKVIRREEGAAGTTFVCRADESETVVAD
jgi:hypothetical protein